MFMSSASITATLSPSFPNIVSRSYTKCLVLPFWCLYTTPNAWHGPRKRTFITLLHEPPAADFLWRICCRHSAVLQQLDANGVYHPLAYVSRRLIDTVRRYNQIEREALAIAFGAQIFHQYLPGRSFTLLTDHEPLDTLLGEKMAFLNWCQRISNAGCYFSLSTGTRLSELLPRKMYLQITCPELPYLTYLM